MSAYISSNINARALARLISNAGFKRLTDKDDCKAYSKQMKKILTKGGVQFPNKITVRDLIDFSYEYLQKEYRHEYIYKTSLLSRFILKNYSLCDSVILNEFKVGKSKADIVVVNGTNKVFEIKTELDTPERLKTQIVDYYRAFSEVYIVTHHTLQEKYINLLEPGVGLIVFDADNSLREVRSSVKVFKYLDPSSMFRCLRKQEFLFLIKKLHGAIPEASSFTLFRECLSVVSKYNPEIVQKYFLEAIKQRVAEDDQLIVSQNIPHYLQFICYLLNFKEKQYISLQAHLSQPI